MPSCDWSQRRGVACLQIPSLLSNIDFVSSFYLFYYLPAVYFSFSFIIETIFPTNKYKINNYSSYFKIVKLIFANLHYLIEKV